MGVVCNVIGDIRNAYIIFVGRKEEDIRKVWT
jgi:hypothetical protein